MNTYNNTISTLQGQTFTIDKVVRFRNGDPYIISSELENPFVVLSLATSKATKEFKYYKTWWDNVDQNPSWPRFYETTPRVLEQHLSDAEVEEYYTWPSNSHAVPNQTRCIFKGPDGSYFYYVKLGSLNVRKAYQFRYSKTFDHNTVKEWQGGEYVYDIRVVSGISTYQHLLNTLHNYGLAYSNKVFNVNISNVEYNVAYFPGRSYLLGIYDLGTSIPMELNNVPNGWYIWENTSVNKYRPFDDTFIAQKSAMSNAALMDFARSETVLNYIKEQENVDDDYLKGYTNYVAELKKCDIRVPLVAIDHTEFLLKPTAFKVASVVRGGLNG